MKFITLNVTNGKTLKIKSTSILAMEEKGDCTIVYFPSGTVRVIETQEEIESLIKK